MVRTHGPLSEEWIRRRATVVRLTEDAVGGLLTAGEPNVRRRVNRSGWRSDTHLSART